MTTALILFAHGARDPRPSGAFAQGEAADATLGEQPGGRAQQAFTGRQRVVGRLGGRGGGSGHGAAL